VPPQVLDIQHLEPRVFGRADHVMQIHNLATGENRTRNEQALRIALQRSGPRNSMIQK
jgi:hypothetical protein